MRSRRAPPSRAISSCVPPPKESPSYETRAAGRNRTFSMKLAPDDAVSPQALARGKRAMVQDAAWASLVGALYGGVILVGFALELGASPFFIGLLASIPFLSQLAQVPALLLIERLRQRRKIAVLVVWAAR